MLDELRYHNPAKQQIITRETALAAADEISRLRAKIRELEKVIRLCLEREKEHARIAGYSDCTCINFSSKGEAEYEAGKCPHQLANVVLEAVEVKAED